MCVYCMMADQFWKYDPPWRPDPVNPLLPKPLVPFPPLPYPYIQQWDLARLKEVLDLLEKIKALEDQLGCPCEPSKEDHILLFKERIKFLEGELRKAKAAKVKKRSPAKRLRKGSRY